MIAALCIWDCVVVVAVTVACAALCCVALRCVCCVALRCVCCVALRCVCCDAMRCVRVCMRCAACIVVSSLMNVVYIRLCHVVVL